MDDGCGMDYDTLKNKLLVLGGSKKAEGSVGAFGKAKELLFFSWMRYEIHTNEWTVRGEGADYTISKSSHRYAGTKVSIWIGDEVDMSILRMRFRYVARQFETSSKIYINSTTPVDTSLKRGELIRSLSWANVYIDRNATDSYYMNVRIEGMWMFNTWLSSMHGLGEILVEVKGQSTDVMTSNRDAFKDKYRQEFSKLMEAFATETKSMLDPEPIVVREKFTGTGRVAVSMESKKEAMITIFEDFADWRKSEEDALVDQILDALPEENVTIVDIDRVTETVRRGSVWDHEDRFKFIGFQPDFHILYDEEEMSPSKVKQYMGYKNTPKLANAWTEVLKQVLLDIEVYEEFNVGFNFSLTTAASYEKIDGEHYFYLNPHNLLSDLQRDGEPKVKWQNNKTLLMHDLLLKAIHEVTHLFRSSHNEDFILKSEWIRAQTWKSMKTYQTIMKETFANY